MTLARTLYERFRQLIHEVAKFGVIGGIGFVVTDGGTNLLHFKAGLGPNSATVLATAVAMVVTYLGNRYWTFRQREGSNMGREGVVFVVLNGVGILIQMACISFTYYLLGLHDKLSYNVALFIGIALGTLFRFWSYRKWIWIAPAAGGGTGLAATGPVPHGSGPAAPSMPPSVSPSLGELDGREWPVDGQGRPVDERNRPMAGHAPNGRYVPRHSSGHVPDFLGANGHAVRDRAPRPPGSSSLDG